MTDPTELDVESLMARVRASLGQGAGPGPAPGGTDAHQFLPTVDAAALHASYDITRVTFTSHHRLVGRLIVAAKKILRQLLTPILDRQVEFNAAVMRVTADVGDSLAALARGRVQALQDIEDSRREVQRLDQRLDVSQSQLREEWQAAASEMREALDRQMSEMQVQWRAARERDQAALAPELLAARQLQGEWHSTLSAISERFQALEQSGRKAGHRLSGAERKLRRIVHDLGAGTERPPAPDAEADLAAAAGREPAAEFDYAGFEDRFRGDQDDIKERQRPYVKHFDGQSNVIEIGCGRGEFLELLRERGVDARGVELDLDMALECRDKGLDVVAADAFDHLRALPDGSLGGVFASQVIEHMAPARVIELVHLCHRKLARGAALVLETPNPSCLMVFADSFYKDPTHIQPIHPDTLQFLLEASGFAAVEVAFCSPVDPSMKLPRLELPGASVGPFNQGIDRLNALLFGFQDYAVIGTKS